MIMSQTVDVNTEPLRWPIAPDGYIPNSVIRNRMVGRRRKEELKTETEFSWDDIFNSLHLADESSDEEDLSTRHFWFIDDEEEDEDEDKTDDVKWRKKEEKVKKNEKEEKAQVGGKERMDEKNEKEEVKMDGVVLLRQSNDIQPTTTLLHQPKTFDDGRMNVEPQRQEVVSTYTSRKTVNFLPTSCHENEPQQLREQREDMKLPETITPILQYLPVSKNQRTSRFIPKACLEPPVESPVVSADAFIPKKEPRMTMYIPPIEPPKPPPPSPEEPQPQPAFGSPECPPIRDKSSLLSSIKFHSDRDQAQVPLDQKVLDLYKKSKVFTKDSSLLGKRATIIERPTASKTKHSAVQTSTGGLNLNDGLCSPPEFRSTLSKPPRIVDPECPRPPRCPAQVAQAILPTSDQKGYKSMPEWRKNLYKLIAYRGFCSPRAAKLAAQDQPVKSSTARQFAAIIPSLQPGQAAAHQRVVQKIQTKDALAPASSQFHHGIPMNSQQSFFTLNPCGKTQYGRLQFDWMRGYDEDSVCG